MFPDANGVFTFCDENNNFIHTHFFSDDILDIDILLQLKKL